VQGLARDGNNYIFILIFITQSPQFCKGGLVIDLFFIKVRYNNRFLGVQGDKAGVSHGAFIDPQLEVLKPLLGLWDIRKHHIGKAHSGSIDLYFFDLAVGQRKDFVAVYAFKEQQVIGNVFNRG